jgi:hypothetical protein
MPQAHGRTWLRRLLLGRFGTYWFRSLHRCFFKSIDFRLDYFIDFGLKIPGLAALLASRGLGVAWSPSTSPASTTPAALPATPTRLAIVTIAIAPFTSVAVFAFVLPRSFDSVAPSAAAFVAAAAIIAAIMPFLTFAAAASLLLVSVMSLATLVSIARRTFRRSRYGGLPYFRFGRLLSDRRRWPFARRQTQFAGEAVPIDCDLFRGRLRRARLRPRRFLGRSLSRIGGRLFPLARFRRYLDANLSHQLIPI